MRITYLRQPTREDSDVETTSQESELVRNDSESEQPLPSSPVEEPQLKERRGKHQFVHISNQYRRFQLDDVLMFL
ncbi:hypothetical protein V6N11_006815 [Hibiscus sabdariffa]|uniref:Uncharacterized protein n=1 Tax=Hibiscus sabdariffa TaxID=183260 RepID=A0ABR2RS14_9ROSI